MNQMDARPMSSARRRGLTALAASACALVLAAPASAALGDLDGSYGTGGRAKLDAQAIDVTDAILDGSGRAVLAGVAGGTAVVGRIAADGGGVEWFPSPPDAATTVAVTLAPDGHIVVAGSDPAAGVFVRRYTAAGTLDDWGGTFPAAGYGGASAAVIQDVAVQPSGRILAAGWVTDPSLARDEFLLAAFGDLAGRPDTSFAGGAGYARAGITGVNWHAYALALDPVSSAATLTGDTGASGIPLARFGVNGSADGTALVAATGPADRALDLTILPNGRLMLAGISYGQSQAALLGRLMPTLEPDAGFDADGFARYAEGTAFAAVAADPAGGVYAAGSDDQRALLAKVDDHGRYDAVLGTAGARPGLVAVDAVTGPDRGLGVGVDGNGRPHLIGGSAPDQAAPTGLATRHLPNAPPTAAFTGPATLQPGQPALFQSASTDPENALRRWEWDFDGDGAFETDGGTSAGITHTFAAPGSFAVSLRVTDHGNLQATATRFLTVAAPPPGELHPVLGRSAKLAAARGVVRVRLPGAKRFVRIDRVRLIPNGTEVDARKGRARLTVARNSSGAEDSTDFYLGRFVFRQAKGPSPYTTLTLAGGDFTGCGPSHPKLAVTARKKGRHRVVRRLWGDGKGRFRTRGRYASATVRGTRWQTIDRCDGVSLVVARGVVTFRDLLRGRPSRRVAAGQTAFVPSGKRAGG
jgi:hypothetical protein